MANHPIVHLEFSANDPKAAGKFYSDLFDWTIQVDDKFNYVMFRIDEGMGGGFNPVGQTESAGFQTNPGDVLVYIGTDDIDTTLARAESLGGKVVAPKTEIPGMGWFGVFEDPTGNKVGLFTSLNPRP